MATTVEVDDARATQLVELMTCGRRVAGFGFEQRFTLLLHAPDAPPVDASAPPPREVAIHLDGPWQLGDDAAWAALRRRFPPNASVEPDEPVQAWALAELYGADAGVVMVARVTDAELRLTFGDGRVLWARHDPDNMSADWKVVERHVAEPQRQWSVVSEHGAVFGRTPT